MEDNSERKDHFKGAIFGEWIKKAKNPAQILGLVTIYAIGTYKNIIPLDIIPITFCFFMVFCIMCRDNINIWIKYWCKMKEHEFDQKTKTDIEKQKCKRAKYEYLKALEKESEKSKNDTINQSDDDSPCKMYEIKRSGS